MTDLSHDGTDDGFHEIQLSGKQLVFLFMATTVVSVVIFLCGVLVGRGVRSEAVNAGSTPAMASAGPNISTPPAAPLTPPQPADGGTPEALSYQKRLDGDKPPVDTLKARAEREAPPAAPEPTPTSTQPLAAKADTPKSAPVAVTPPAGGAGQPGIWAVQVVALTDRAAANAVVQRLSSKGYPAFLVSPQSGSAVQNYKVQVGRFEDRSQAELTAGRLKKEEQFQPWILR